MEELNNTCDNVVNSIQKVI